jgi:putative membrane protein
MFKKTIVSTALMAVGVIASLGYTAVAQTNQPTTQQNPTDRPANQANPTNQRGTDSGSSQLSEMDRQFVIQAAQGNMAEVALSRLALERAASDDVKQYAQQMIQDHTQANTRLSQLLSQKGINITPPQTLDPEHQAISQQLSQFSGKRFDQEYTRVMEMDHNRTVKLFQTQAQQGQDPDLRAFATNTLPKLDGHLQMVRAMLGNTTGQNPSSHNRHNQ